MIAQPLSLRRPLLHIWIDAVRETAQALRAAWRERAERRVAEAVEHELLALDPRTLDDIGAPQGLVGQRRWQDERQRSQDERLLELRGW